MKQTSHDILIAGAGIFGLTAAIELRKRKHTVLLLNPGTIPHPSAASTDISKVVRMEYGSDEQYMDMADRSIDGWHAWNDLFKDELYHETGFLLVCKRPMEMEHQDFELQSYYLLQKKGHRPQRMDPFYLRDHFPALNREVYHNGFYHPRAGYAESGRTVATLLKYARELGVTVHENQELESLVINSGRAEGGRTRDGSTYSTGKVVICAGAYTPYLIPELQPFMQSTGHPVFHVKPSRPELFTFPNLPVFAADISNSGWYGFPLHPREHVVKIGHHGQGQQLHPGKDVRVVSEEQILHFREFLKEILPALVNDPIVHTRCCLYCDTLDGHFWIDRHPEIENLTIGTGGSGHGFKMAPVLGRLIANAVAGDEDPWLARFRWRDIAKGIGNEEASRSKK